MLDFSVTHHHLCLVAVIFRRRYPPGSEASLLLMIFSQHKSTLEQAIRTRGSYCWGGRCTMCILHPDIQFLSLRIIHHLSVVSRNTVWCQLSWEQLAVRGALLLQLQSHNFRYDSVSLRVKSTFAITFQNCPYPALHLPPFHQDLVFRHFLYLLNIDVDGLYKYLPWGKSPLSDPTGSALPLRWRRSSPTF